MGNRQEINPVKKVNPVGKVLLAATLMLGIGTAAEACGEGDNSPSNTGQRTETPVSSTPSPLIESPTPVITEAPTPAPTPEPSQTPVAWSDESISADLEKATGLTYILSLRVYPDSIEYKTASTEAQAALQEYQTIHESGDYSSIQGTIDKFAKVGRIMLSLACYDAYAEATGSNYIHYKDIVRNLGSRFEHEGYLEAGTTESLMLSLTAPADCTNEKILKSK